MKILFLHPDLGIGGAEKAVIDSALALKSRGHNVHFITNHHDTNHCFEATRDGTIDVTVVCGSIPTNIFGRCRALCAYIKFMIAAIYAFLLTSFDYDMIFCDQISICVPILKLSGKKVIFYCHFPDMLLTKRESIIKWLYRKPLDFLEEYTTGKADCILVNSQFTASVFKSTFKSLNHITPLVLYPIPDLKSLSRVPSDPTPDLMPSDVDIIFLSINRYERKKNLSLALKAMAKVLNMNDDTSKFHLIICGGYDERNSENKEHYLELKDEADSLKLTKNITFLFSISDEQKLTLLANSTCLLYTPDNEHFGIVPIEAMYLKCPVIAVNSGGPKETVLNEETGFLCDPDSAQFSLAMQKFIDNDDLKLKMGQAGHQRILNKFSFDNFTEELNEIILSIYSSNS